MKKRLMGLAVALIGVMTVSLFALWPAAGAVSGKIADHALIDQTGGDTFVQCRTTNSRAFDVHATLRAFGGDVTVRVVFQDGDFVEYPVAQKGASSTPRSLSSLVVWPPKGRLEDEHCPTERQFYSEGLKAEIRDRYAAGETLPELARKTGMSFGSVKSICGREAERKLARRQARRVANAR
jgi:hypothetical protein